MKTNRYNSFGRVFLGLVYALVIGMYGLVPPDLVGQVTDPTTMRNLPIGVKGATIASASSIDLGAATGDFVDVSGTTTITALGTIMAGREVTVRFTGALTLAHNGTSLILPGGVSIETAAGDVARFKSLGSGNWVCVAYQRAAAAATVTQETSASTAVAANGRRGVITTVTQNIAAAGEVQFTVNNTSVGAGDTVIVNVASGSTGGTTIASVTAVAADSFQITLTNLHASTAETGTLVLNFTVVNGVGG